MAEMHQSKSGAAPAAWFTAAVLVALLTGCTATTEADVSAEPVSPADPSRDVSAEPPMSPSPTPTMPPHWCKPAELPRASLPEAVLPAPEDRVILEPDPCLTARSLLGWGLWLEDQGIDSSLIQGFQSVAGLRPWIAPLADGSGRCIIVGWADGGGSGTVACDSAGVPATVERTADESVLRFLIEDGGIAVYAVSP
ncbi:hypothetical protein [Microbacterium hibisci]|uniref:hypothetical protein n=1 Tax=Microbacterium hibisci TaxID=2036000 RepID=UPI001944519C|nr:hypothetical protein [Microbacterium hibisci]